MCSSDLRAELYPGRIVVTWADNAIAVSPELLIRWVDERSDRAKMLPPAKLEIRYGKADSMRQALEDVSVELEELLGTKKVPAEAS